MQERNDENTDNDIMANATSVFEKIGEKHMVTLVDIHYAKIRQKS